MQHKKETQAWVATMLGLNKKDESNAMKADDFHGDPNEILVQTTVPIVEVADDGWLVMDEGEQIQSLSKDSLHLPVTQTIELDSTTVELTTDIPVLSDMPEAITTSQLGVGNQIRQESGQIDTNAKDQQLSTPLETLTKAGAKTLIGRFGAYVSELGHVNHKSFTGVDLTKQTTRTDVFHQQGGQLLGQLFGNKGTQVQAIADKLLPKTTQQGINDWFYDSIAKLAKRWALAELQKDERFAHVSKLTLAQKQALLHDMYNQNRGLAVVGGVAGVLGLKGVVLDTAWLLLVSLKAVYQTAYIADKPFMTDDSHRLVYGILAGANLDKMQEKQVLMTGLALGKAVLQNAQHTGFTDDLKRLRDKYHLPIANLNGVAIILDRLNGKLVQRLLPIGSALLAGYYNSQLIEEVLGVAQASFAELRDGNVTHTIENGLQNENADSDEQAPFWHSRAVDFHDK